jgi:two-component sensor histidine kinase/PAS domain-containing protein
VTLFVRLASNLKGRHATQVAGFAGVAIAAVVLIGWWWELPLLSAWRAGPPATSPFGALCLTALGLALIRPRDDILAVAVGLVVAAVAAVDLGLALFVAEPGAGREPLFAMPAATALGVGLAGGALMLSRFERHYVTAAVLSGLAGAVAVFVLLGYLTGTNTLYNATAMSSPPLPTAVALLCIASGIIMRIGAKPEFRRPRPLWHFLAVLGWAIVVPLLLFGAYGSGRLADAQLDQVRRGMIDEVTNVSSDVDREILGEIETLQALAASPSLRDGDFAAFQRQAEAPLTLRRSGSIELFDRSARQIVNTSAPFGTPMPQGMLREEVERAFATGKTQITNLYEAPGGKFQYSIIIPVKIDGEIRYALARSPSEHSLEWTITGNQLPSNWKAVVFDAAHRIIAQSEQTPGSVVGKELPPSQWGRGGSGIVEFTDSEGRPSLQAYHQSELTGWSTAIWATNAVLGAPLQAVWQALGWMALLAFSLVVGLALWVGRIISQSVGHAARAAVALGEGRALPPDGTPVAEVNTLMAELEETAAKRQAAEDFLRDREWRLQLALAAAQLGSWQYDPVRRVLSGDARAKEILDVPGNELVIDALMERVHPDDLEGVAAAFVGSLDPANTKRPATEFRLRHRDSKFRWLETLGLVHFEGTGRERRAVSIVGTVADITTRKELEEESKARAEKEHLLMREMSHRAKNMLSVVDAIAHQTATRSPEHFVSRFSERIQSLSASQDLLLRNEWKGVEIKGLVHAQLAHFADLIGSRISVGGPELRLKEASAQAIGLALHELATNAGKYGALSMDTGHVEVCWEAVGDAFSMSWTESGGPPVSPPKRRGFGTIVMGVMAERSVCGKVALDYPPSGVTWHLACPAANALETGEGRQTGEREQTHAERSSAA